MRAFFLISAALLVTALALSWRAPSEAQADLTAKPKYVLKRIARGLQEPVYVTTAPGESNRLYVVLKSGVVRVLSGGRLQPAPFLDIRQRVLSFREMGLLSIAFHPGYRSNRLVYAVFNDNVEARPVSLVEYHVVDGRADVSSARVLVRVPHADSAEHNGGLAQLGPDGALYLGIGDGGYLQEGRRPVPDPHGNAQNLDVLLGKLVRLDVSAASSEPEVVAYGLRNPWRFSFAPNGDLVIADVGWNTAEEINVLARGSGLVNFGWSAFEGRGPGPNPRTLNTAGTLTGPVLTYPSLTNGNCSIIGGYVYRGRAVKSLRGRYVFGDYCSGRIWSVRIAGRRASGLRLEPVRVPDLVSFGEDERRELYAVSLGGAVYRFARP